MSKMASKSDGTASEECITYDYGLKFVSRLQEFRDSDLLFDFTLIVEQESFKVHRLVLAACSDYFRALFSHDMLESKKDSIELQQMPVAGFRPLIQYAYSGKINLSMETVSDIINVASFLQMTQAIDLCCDFMKQKMTYESADEILSLADMYGLDEVSKYHKQLVLDNFEEFTKTEAFINLEPEVLQKYLLSDSLQITSEAKLLQAVLKWYTHDTKGRRKDLFNCMEKVRLVMDGWPTIEAARHHDLLTDIPEIQNLVIEATHYMEQPERKHLSQSHRTRVRFPCKSLVQFGGEANLRNEADEFHNMFFPAAFGHGRGGMQNNHFYHRLVNRWCGLGVLSVSDPRSHQVVVEVNDMGIQIGGYKYTANAQNQRVATRDVALFTPGGGFALWELTSMNEDRAHHAAVRVKGYVYVIGGKNNKHDLASCEKFDLESNEWQFIQPLHEATFDHAAANCEDKVFLTGGTMSGEVVDHTLCYSVEDDKWSLKAKMQTERTGHAMQSLNGKLIACGGRTEKINGPVCVASVETYDPSTDQWTLMSPMRHEAAYMASVVLDNKLLIVGGESTSNELLNYIQEYDPATKKWGMFQNTLFKRMKHVGLCAVTCNLNKDGHDDHMYRDEVVKEFSRMYLGEHHVDYSDDEEDVSDYHHWMHAQFDDDIDPIYVPNPFFNLPLDDSDDEYNERWPP